MENKWNVPTRVAGVFFFACNMDPSGVKQIEPSPILDCCFGPTREGLRHYQPRRTSSTFVEAVGLIQKNATQLFCARFG
jgi:hypothetical protein